MNEDTNMHLLQSDFDACHEAAVSITYITNRENISKNQQVYSAVLMSENTCYSTVILNWSPTALWDAARSLERECLWWWEPLEDQKHWGQTSMLQEIDPGTPALLNLTQEAGQVDEWVMRAGAAPAFQAPVNQAWQQPTDVNHDCCHKGFKNPSRQKLGAGGETRDESLSSVRCDAAEQNSHTTLPCLE